MRMILRIFSILAICCVGMAHAARVNPFSEYGQIQTVQNYSSNPLWNPNGPYNQTFPRPVYVDGPDLNSGDCQRTVFALIGSYCMTNNNCYGMQVSDIRPSIMLQLSCLPGHNWATQCVGYIDGAFEEYMKSAQNHVPTTAVGFPQGAVPSTPPAEYKIKNPFAPQIPDWVIEMQERKQELKQLQSQTSNYDTSLSYSNFPKTYQDLSFGKRMQIEQEGYEPYRNKSPYAPIKIDDQEPTKNTNQSSIQGTTQNPASAPNTPAAQGAQSGNAQGAPSQAPANTPAAQGAQSGNAQGTPSQAPANAPAAQGGAHPASAIGSEHASNVQTYFDNTNPQLLNLFALNLQIGDMPSVSQNDNECCVALRQMINNYVAEHPWGRLNADGTCEDLVIGSTDFHRAIYNWFQSSDKCSLSVSHHYKIFSPLTTTSPWYAEIEILSESHNNSFTANITACKDIRIAPIVS